MTDSVAGSVFGKTSGVFYKHESFMINDSDKLVAESVFVKLHAYTISDNDEFVADSMTESVFSLRL